MSTIKKIIIPTNFDQTMNVPETGKVGVNLRNMVKVGNGLIFDDKGLLTFNIDIDNTINNGIGETVISLANRVSKNESSIEQLTNDVAAKASHVDLSTAQNTLNTRIDGIKEELNTGITANKNDLDHLKEEIGKIGKNTGLIDKVAEVDRTTDDKWGTRKDHFPYYDKIASQPEETFRLVSFAGKTEDGVGLSLTSDKIACTFMSHGYGENYIITRGRDFSKDENTAVATLTYKSEQIVTDHNLSDVAKDIFVKTADVNQRVEGVKNFKHIQIDGLDMVKNNVGGRDVIEVGNLSLADFYYRSDKRVKDNIEPIENGLDVIKQLDGKTFDMVGHRHSAGFIAQEVEKVLPFLVAENQDGLKSVNYIPVIAYLVEAVKNLSQQIEELKNKS